MKMAEALIRAGKPHGLLVFPEKGHMDMSEMYCRHAVRPYFMEHLKPQAAGKNA